MATVYKGKIYDDRHGGPFDRGSADCYYGRRYQPHYFKGGTYQTEQVHEHQMTEEDLAAYRAGWDWNAEQGDYKDWG
jgi:hypothetical protein